MNLSSLQQDSLLHTRAVFSTLFVSGLKDFNRATTVYFVLTSQYDILRRGSYTNERHQRLADAAVEKISEMCDVTSVLYSYPQGWEWIVEN